MVRSPVNTAPSVTPGAVTDDTDKVVWQNPILGDPFGASLPDEDPDGDGRKFELNLRFPGQYYDKESGLHYNYYRDYDPSTGRYVKADPIGLNGGLNAYRYVGGNPLSFFDPEGQAKTKIDGKVIEVHKTDVDSWPSTPHGHIEDTRNKIDKDGKIFDKTTKKQVGQLPKKSAAAWAKWLRGKGLLSVCAGALIIPGYTPEDALADLVGAGDAGEKE